MIESGGDWRERRRRESPARELERGSGVCG